MVYPLPEVLPNGDGWKIRASDKPGVDILNKVIFTKLDDDPVTHCVRMTQIGEALWDDGTSTQNHLLFRACEGYRLNYLLRSKEVDMTAGVLTEGEIFQAMMAGDSGLVSAALLTEATENQVSIDERSELGKIFSQAAKRIIKTPTKANSALVCVWLAKVLKDAGSKPIFDDAPGEGGESKEKLPGLPGRNTHKMPVFHGKTQPADGFEVPVDATFQDYEAAAGEALKDDDKITEVPQAVRKQLPDKVEKTLDNLCERRRGQKYPTMFCPWGEMRVEEPPRTRAISGKALKKWNPTEEGCYPRYNHRFFVDGRVFARRKKIPGGTVVIDHSGSMSLGPEGIKAIVEAAPGCVVASYDGDGTYGVLRILAKDGFVVSDDKFSRPTGIGQNVIDYPVLLWAYKKSHPRVWVTDFGVTGVNDGNGPGNLAMCVAVVKKGKFFTVRTVDDALKELKRLVKYYRSH